MKKLIFVSIGALLLAATAYHFSFPVKVDGSNLVAQINDFANRGYTEPRSNSIQLHAAIDLDSQRYILFELNEQLGVVTLVRGLTGGYKIDSLSHGSSNFMEFMVASTMGTHWLFGGRNLGSSIASAGFSLEGKEYSFAIPEGDRFFISEKIEGTPEIDHVLPDASTFSDAAGRDISDKIDWNGASAATR